MENIHNVKGNDSAAPGDFLIITIKVRPSVLNDACNALCI